MRDSVERYHLPHICTFHPVYLTYDPSNPRYSGAAAEEFLSVCERLHVPCPSIEDWCKFIQDRWSVSLTNLCVTPERTSTTLHTDRGVQGLTIFLPGATAATRAMLDDRALSVCADSFEGQEQRYVTIDLAAGRDARLVVMR